MSTEFTDIPARTALAVPRSRHSRFQSLLSRDFLEFDSYWSNLQQLSSMKEIIDLFYKSMASADVINLILVAVTARQGFRFNRAFFLKVNHNVLKGVLGIGPANAEEAHGIWSRLEETNPSLSETLGLLSQAGGPPDPATQALARQIELPLGPDDGFEGASGILNACKEKRPALVSRSSLGSAAEEEIFDILGVDALAVVPLNVQDRLAGVLLADNFITGRSISQEDLDLLKAFSGYAAIALERSHLHDELTRNLEKLRRANRDLQTNQRKLVQAEKLSALGKMAAYVSHEIRNPLVAIGGLARSVLVDSANSEESREALEIVVGEVSRLERFLKETLNFVKPPVGPFEPVDLNQVIRSVVNTFRDRIQEAQIDLTLSLPEEPAISLVDPDLLKGALSNLIKNAQDVLKSGGLMGIHLTVSGALAEIDVGDNGPGIPETAKNLIFEPFFTTKEDGTGIGLAITQQNIHSLGGSISLGSDSRYQTLFKIRLPIVTSM